METIEGNIVDVVNQQIFKGRVYFDNRINRIEKDDSITSDVYILPGLIDAHVHIESSMCTPFNYAKEAVKHGVVAAIADPHEIANVCGVDGVIFMKKSAQNTPMKIFLGAPSCVPATSFETSGAVLDSFQIEKLFENNVCTHLSEMMNYPGVIYGDEEVIRKINIAKKYNKVIDGHAPLLSGEGLKKYFDIGITTDHECTTIEEAVEKIELGFKIMLRKSSASNDFSVLHPLVKKYPDSVMLCTDDCHPDELIQSYIDGMVHFLLNNGYSIFDVYKAAIVNAQKHFSFDIGLLQENDSADFIVVNDLDLFKVQKTFINGEIVFDGNKSIKESSVKHNTINQFFINEIGKNDLSVPVTGSEFKLIEIVENSLITKKKLAPIPQSPKLLESDVENDILKIVVLNRYNSAKPSIGFIKGFGLKKGACATTVAHDSHNIVAIGVNDDDLLHAISSVQRMQGGMVYVNEKEEISLPLPVAGLMSDKPCGEVAHQYKQITDIVKANGSQLHAPYMTMSFMSLLVIPELKLGDKGLFDVTKFEFTDLQV